MKRSIKVGLLILVGLAAISIFALFRPHNFSTDNSIKGVVALSPTAYFFSELTMQGDTYDKLFPHLEKIIFHANGTYTAFTVDLGVIASTSFSGIWEVGEKWNDLMLTPVVSQLNRNGHQIWLASSTPSHLRATGGDLYTELATKETCEKIPKNIWVESLGGCWQEQKALDALDASAPGGP